ncbi:type II toxin-antitoxin system VapC family toxin [Subtercola lobariae]|uniref:Ribonuclease VapC n=1 Tax=Subtercola lobariae TaxID=1588641 RepID=A0A917B568_9MICO|nr:PIN domain-containing protein [Subtercola lobariae]GGF20867.1 hypothetical protein GCM10011399_13130 [Subtercola lobariae]
MIVLDANVLIAFLDSSDLHHNVTLEILDAFAPEGYGASVLTVAEALVYPTRNNSQDRSASAFARIGLMTVPLAQTDALDLARIRSQYGVRMPDAVALFTALSTQSTLATFDIELAAAARAAGVDVVGAANESR